MSGVIDYAEVREHLQALYDVTMESRTFVEFLDLRQAASIDVDSEQAKSIGAIVSKLHDKYDHSHVIAVAPADASFGVTRMIQAFVSLNNPTVSWHIHRELDSARATLFSLTGTTD